MKTILIIDDDEYIGNMLEETLVKEGYFVLRAYSGTEALLLLSRQTPQLVLLDLMLPGLSGEELLPRLSGIPVIVISAKIDHRNKINLLLGGAVDYVTKPFNMEELLARIAVQFRKYHSSGQPRRLTFRDLALDTDVRSVHVGETPVHLTKTEYAILLHLMHNPSHVLTKSRLLELISEDTPDCVESSLKVHISNLRKKLREPGGRDYIEAVWGIGFKMNEK